MVMDDKALTIRHRNGKVRLTGPGGRRFNDFSVLATNDMAAGVQSCGFLTDFEGVYTGSKGQMAVKLIFDGEYLGEKTPVIQFQWGRTLVLAHVKMAAPIAVLLRTAAAPPSDLFKTKVVRVRAAVELAQGRGKIALTDTRS